MPCDGCMMPASTRHLAAAACALVVLWLWAWGAAQWTLKMPAANQQPTASRSISQSLEPNAPAGGEIDSTSLLRSPAFYPDRRPHPFQPGAPGDQPVQATKFDYQLTTTVIGKKHAFAMLRLPGSNQSLIARLGEPFEGDPAWHVTEIDNVSIRFTGNQGQEVRLALKPPAPVQPPFPAPSMPVSASLPATATLNVPNAAAPPAPSIQPTQGNAELRVRIEARRREAAASATTVRTQ